MTRLSTGLELEKQKHSEDHLSKVPSLEDEFVGKLEDGEVPTPSQNATDDLITDWKEGLVGWDSHDDPLNPRNWPRMKKIRLMVLIATISTLSPLSSSMFAPGTAFTMADLDSHSEIMGSFMISIFILGYAIGPLFLGPLSELYGRYPVVVASTWFFNAWILGCSFAPSMGALIVMRLLAGVGGSGSMTIAPAIVGEIYRLERRATASALIIACQCLGPVVGPIAGGFMSERLGWRYPYWILLAVNGAVTVLLTFFMDESRPSVLLERKTQRLRKETGREDLQSRLHVDLTTSELILRSLVRPVKLLTRSVIAILICLYIAFIYGITYLLFTTIPTVFSDTYGWPLELTGLAYLGIAFGFLLALAVIILTNDANVQKLRDANNGVFEPEMRLYLSYWYALCIPISLIWYGWTAQYHVHWMSPIIATLLFGVGMLGIFLPGQTYMVDAFPLYAASAVAAVTCCRSVLGAFLPLAGPPLYESLGLGWGNTLLGLISLVMVPVPWVFYRHGGRIRRRYPVTL